MFIDTNPLGYNFPVEERGEGVSGGQKQLIGLSRFFLRKNSNILLLDEPTNALDNQTETKTLDTLNLFMKEKTALFTSHKRNMIQLSSRIIVLSKGKISYDGSRDSVLRELGTKV